MDTLKINWDVVSPKFKYVLREKIEARDSEDETSKMFRRMGLQVPMQKASLSGEYCVALSMKDVIAQLKSLSFKPASGLGHAGMMAHNGAHTYILRDGPKGTCRIHVRTFR